MPEPIDLIFLKWQRKNILDEQNLRFDCDWSFLTVSMFVFLAFWIFPRRIPGRFVDVLSFSSLSTVSLTHACSSSESPRFLAMVA
jgi:hypothetical protein